MIKDIIMRENTLRSSMSELAIWHQSRLEQAMRQGWYPATKPARFERLAGERE
jgi:hypothetical protein